MTPVLFAIIFGKLLAIIFVFVIVVALMIFDLYYLYARSIAIDVGKPIHLSSNLRGFESNLINGSGVSAPGSMIPADDKDPVWIGSAKAVKTFGGEVFDGIDVRVLGQVASEYFDALGYSVSETRNDTEGKLQLLLANRATLKPGLLLHCMVLNELEVGQNHIEALLGDMNTMGLTEGFILTTGGFSDAAKNYPIPAGFTITRIDSKDLVERISRLPSWNQWSILKHATARNTAVSP